MEKPTEYTLTWEVTDEMTAKRIGSAGSKILSTPNTVSYTHLDVYKRQAMILVLVLLCTALPCSVLAAGEGESHETTVLFTHDLHSHFLPQTTADGGESGGYARLATVLQQERAQHPNALTLDGGDFSIGSLIQTLYTSKAPELRTMGALGYDATTAGNHEFDHEGLGFARMLTAARNNGDTVPALLMANYKPSADNPDQLDIQRAMSAYGCLLYTSRCV